MEMNNGDDEIIPRFCYGIRYAFNRKYNLLHFINDKYSEVITCIQNNSLALACANALPIS